MNTFSLTELEQLPTERLLAIQDKCASVIRSREAQEKKKATKRIIELAAAHGINLSDVQKSAKCYRNPLNQFDTWSGRGPHPKWVQAHLNSGGVLEDLLVTQ
jgi:DNA-binding protein H-NS